jgi:16S rRNA (uracil1498-N3)-methyltransferase
VAVVIPSSARAHVFVEDLVTPRLADDDLRHLTRVLRLAPGTEVTVSDGAGSWRACRLGTGPELEAVSEIVTEPRPEPALTVAFAVVKGERPELAVQKLTEVGVDRIVPFVAERSVVHWDASKAARHRERFGIIARQAAMQCRRCYLPEVAELADFPTVAQLPGVALADPGGEPPSLSVQTVLVGPEGGWSEAERRFRLPLVRLGAHTLRSETAAITAGALLVAMRSRIVNPAVPAQVKGPHGT